MHRLAVVVLFLTGLLLALPSVSTAQTVTISPTMPSVAVGKTVQFKAKIDGVVSTAVTWSAGGVTGGNATAGTISTTGLYKAPAAQPAQNPVQITATSTASKSDAATTYVIILTLGPKITAVAPNPIALGPLTVTITGTGLLPGAEVVESYTGASSVALSTASVTSNAITATGYQGNAVKASFKVKNSGSAFSNSLSVPVTGGEPTYKLTVTKGSGSGTYAAGTVVTIKANAAPSGQAFLDWTGAAVAAPKSSTTTLTMPAAATTVTANYAAGYKLTVVSGTGSGTYVSGAVVTITAAAAPAGKAFASWTGATVANAKASPTTLTMPAAATTVTANFAIAYPLTVVGGSGSGSYAAGVVVPIAASPAPAGQIFSKWTGAAVANASLSSTTLTMPAGATTVTATYKTAPTFALIVVNGTGSGTYAAGTVVSISANAPPAGQSFLDWTGAAVAGATASSTTLTMPAAAATVTANYTAGGTGIALTVVNGSGTGNYPAGAVVTITANSPPAGQAFLDWNQFTTTFPSQATTTLVMPTYPITVQANYLPITSATIPYPVATHPRLWITPTDLTRLQGWATSANPVYQQGMKPLLAQAVSVYNTQFFPNGQPNANYPDPGDVQGYDTYVTEQYAVILAFNSLIDPVAANRVTYAQDARNLLMHAMNIAALGHLSGAGWRDPLLATYNRANGTGEQWPLIVDWLYNAKDGQGNAILTAADKATIRTVFMLWANDCLNAYTDYSDRPMPEAVTNSHAILPNNLPYRMASNNYYLGHARLMTMMALAMDPSDDPPVNISLPAAQLGNTLRSYILDANGAWLYQEYAMMGDAPAVAGAYGIGSTAGYGLAAGGLPPEGMLYGHSFGFILGQLLALQTAGFNQASLSGPQIGLIGAPVWDRFVTGYLSSLTPAPFVPASEPYLGPVYQFGSFGDILRLWVTPDTMQTFALLDLLDHENGQTSHDDAARWLAVDVVQGGSAGLMSRIADPFSWSSSDAILYYMLMDPAATAPTDPRPAYPTVFVDPGASRIVAHSDWTPTGAMFDYRASWITIYHQNGDGGQFEFFRNGDWLTKEMSNYDNNMLGLTTTYHNTLALRNWCANGTPSNLQFYEGNIWALGSQWMEGANAGDPTTVTSSGPGYVYASSDLTNLYNRPNQWTPADSVTDITQATRSIVWLNNDTIVIYDRATSIHPGLFKRFNLSLVTSPLIVGNTATETLSDGQQLSIQTLLPKSPSIMSTLSSNGLNPIADLEPTSYILTVQDPTLPTDTRFLHVLQGANPGVGTAPAAYLKSTAGTAFDGAAFGTSVVYFPVSVGTFAGTTIPAPTGVHTALIAGLTPGASYGASISGGSITITTTGATASADSAGLLRLTF